MRQANAQAEKNRYQKEDAGLFMIPDYEIFESDLKRAHEHSIRHRDELARSATCGCFYCLDIFDYKDITEWIDADNTALCPDCTIDSVIGSESGFPVTKDFLKAMKEFWFE